VVFDFSQGQLPVWSSLARSADTMYGGAKDPATGLRIRITLERTRSVASADRRGLPRPSHPAHFDFLRTPRALAVRSCVQPVNRGAVNRRPEDTRMDPDSAFE